MKKILLKKDTKYQMKNKPSRYTIDQSGKIEQTERQTVIACTNGTEITIDKEYLGHEDLIEEKIRIYLEQLGITNTLQIEFGHVGKLSAAHNLAYLVAIGKKKPNLIVDAKEVIKVILGTKKIGTA